MSIRRDEYQLDITIGGRKAGATLGQLRGQSRQLNRELSKLTPGTDAFVKKSAELRKVNKRLADVRKQTRGISRSMDGLKRAFIGFFAIGSITRFLGALGRTAISLDVVQNKARTVFGDDGLAIVERFAAVYSDALGISDAETVKLATSIGDLLIPMGFTREAAAQLSVEILKQAGALSEWTGGTISAEQAAEILNKALLGEREQLKTLGISIKEVDVTQRLAAKGQKELTGAALQQAKALATLELITEKSADATASFASGNGSLIRNISRIRAGVKSTADNVAAFFLPAMRDAAGAIADLIRPLKSAADAERNLQAQFNAEIEVLKSSNLTLEERKTAVSEINARYKEYLPNLVTEKDTLQDLANIQSQVNQTFREKILFISYEEEFAAALRESVEASKEAFQAQKDLTRIQSASVAQSAGGFIVTDLDAVTNQSEEAIKQLSADREKALAIVRSLPERQAELRALYEKLAVELGTTFDIIAAKFKKTFNEIQVAGGSGGAADALVRIDGVAKELERTIEEIDAEVFKEMEPYIAAAKEQARQLNATLRDTRAFFDQQFETAAFGITPEDAEKEIDRIERTKLKAIAAARERFAAENDFANARKVIELNAANEVLRIRQQQTEIGSVAYLEYQQQIADNEVEINRVKNETIARLDKQRRDQTLQGFINGFTQASNLLLQSAREQINNELSERLAALQTQYDQDIALAGDNVKQKERIEKRFQKEKTALENVAANDRKNIAYGEAVIQGALAAIEAAPNPALIALAAAITGLNLAIISKQKFAGGGFTGRGQLAPDETGKRPVGIVHEHEYVAPEDQVRRNPELFKWLNAERMRKFAVGGFTTPSVTPNNTFLTAPDSGSTLDDQVFEDMLIVMRKTYQEIKALDLKIRATVSLTDINEQNAILTEVTDAAAI